MNDGYEPVLFSEFNTYYTILSNSQINDSYELVLEVNQKHKPQLV